MMIQHIAAAGNREESLITHASWFHTVISKFKVSADNTDTMRRYLIYSSINQVTVCFSRWFQRFSFTLSHVMICLLSRDAWLLLWQEIRRRPKGVFSLIVLFHRFLMTCQSELVNQMNPLSCFSTMSCFWLKGAVYRKGNMPVCRVKFTVRYQIWITGSALVALKFMNRLSPFLFVCFTVNCETVIPVIELSHSYAAVSNIHPQMKQMFKNAARLWSWGFSCKHGRTESVDSVCSCSESYFCGRSCERGLMNPPHFSLDVK